MAATRKASTTVPTQPDDPQQVTGPDHHALLTEGPPIGGCSAPAGGWSSSSGPALGPVVPPRRVRRCCRCRGDVSPLMKKWATGDAAHALSGSACSSPTAAWPSAVPAAAGRTTALSRQDRCCTRSPAAADRTRSSPGGGPGRCHLQDRWSSSATGPRSASMNPGPASIRGLSSTRHSTASGDGQKAKAGTLTSPCPPSPEAVGVDCPFSTLVLPIMVQYRRPDLASRSPQKSHERAPRPQDHRHDTKHPAGLRWEPSRRTRRRSSRSPE